MRTHSQPPANTRGGYALVLVIVLTGVALVLATGLFDYTSTTARLNHRNNEYQQAVAAAEAATEKVVATVVADYRERGEGYVLGNLSNYRASVPTSAEYGPSGDFLFQDLSGQADRVDVTYASGGGFAVSSGAYRGLRGVRSKLRVVANAKARKSLTGVVGAVYQDIEVDRIPIYQFAIFYNVDLEFDNLPPMTVTGPVHCNTNVWVDPYMPLVFNSDVTSSGTLYENNHTASNQIAGIMHEISYNAIIRNNLVENDAFTPTGSGIWYGAGILVSASSGVEA